MAGDNEVFDAVMAGRGTVNFRDFEHLLLTLGSGWRARAVVTAFTFIRRSAGRSRCSRMGGMQSGTKSASFGI